MGRGVAGFHDTSFRNAYFTNKRVNQAGKYGEYGVVPYQPPICPECGSSRAWKDGLRKEGSTAIQRFLCRDCGYHFSDTVQSDKKENRHTSECRVRVSDNEMINLATVETRTQEWAAGATTDIAEIKGKIIEFAFWMKKNGYAENTITRRARILNMLVKRGADLFNPESVKEAIAKQDSWNSKTKEISVEAYSCFLKMTGGTWKPPRFMKVEKLPFLPTQEEALSLIAGCNRKLSTFLQLLYETGARSGEAWQLSWTDFDFERGIVVITPEKGSKPRILKISQKLIAMLKGLSARSTEQKPFNGSLRHFARTFRRQRAKTTEKFKNPRLKKITFHTFRHLKATLLYHATKDLILVKETLGHRSIQSTMIYTQLINFEEDDYVCKVAKTLKEVAELIESGFEYVTDFENAKLFRKRKDGVSRLTDGAAGI